MRAPACLVISALFFLFLLPSGIFARKLDHLEGTFTETGTLPCGRTDSGKSFDKEYGVQCQQPGVAELHVLSPGKCKRVFYINASAVVMADGEALLTVEWDDEHRIITFNAGENISYPWRT